MTSPLRLRGIAGWSAPIIVVFATFTWGLWSYGSLGAMADVFHGRSMSVVFVDLRDFELKKGRTYVLHAEITNHSKSEFSVVGCRATCSCISVDSVPRSIPAKSQVILPIWVAANSVGKQRHVITLFLNDVSGRAVSHVLNYIVSDPEAETSGFSAARPFRKG